jgi:isoquinoline 1-oxidoreductase beta subunit
VAITRRRFVGGLGLALAGRRVLAASFDCADLDGRALAIADPGAPAAASGAPAAGAGLRPNVFVHVAADGLVTLVCARSEMGQGVRSTIPALLADELGADPARVVIEQADGDKRYGDQNTDGSSSIRRGYEGLRRAAATARTMLIAAAAQRWQVPPARLVARDHAVFDGQRSLSFGQLADAAGKLPVPEPAAVKLRANAELRHVFRALPVVDAPAIVAGTARYGADISLPGMLIAVIARPPAVGDRVSAYNSTRALAVPGVRQVIEMPVPQRPYAFQPWGGVAVLADNTWAAMRGRAALLIRWSHGPNADYDSAAFRQRLSQSVAAPGTPIRDTGDVDAALAGAARLVEAEYHVPHLAHVPMEPPVALARFQNGACEIWAATQNPQAARKEAARVLDLPEEKVTCHVTLLGGAFGRKSKADFVSEAAFLARAAGVPVRVQWTRQDDLAHDYYNAVNTQRLTAGLDARGAVVAWRQRTAFPPISSVFSSTERPKAGDLQQGVTDLPLAIPNVRAEACSAEAHVRIGWLRSVYNIFHAFAAGSFVDEIAHARGTDPRDTLLEIVGPPRIVTLHELGVRELSNYGTPLDEHPIDTARLRYVIQRATEMAGWPARGGRALGLAAHRSFLTYVAVVVSMVRDAGGRPRVDQVWVAVDAGTVVNPDRARAQMEGAVIFGMSHALHGGATMKGGVTQQTNFHDYRLVRVTEAPRRIHVDLRDSQLPPGGIGEPGVPPVAPAIANALFALTGQRVRQLPLFGRDQADAVGPSASEATGRNATRPTWGFAK